MALLQRKGSIRFLDRTIDLHSHTAVFVTMNPSGGLYGGRSELPINLKQLFRPVSMKVPDLEQIAQGILKSEGFRKGKALGFKMVQFLEKCKDELSHQLHYDWGLRALKSVLCTASRLLRQVRITKCIQLKRNLQKRSLSEEACLVASLKADKMATLTKEDRVSFMDLIKDVFQCPADLNPFSDSEFDVSVQNAVEELGLKLGTEQRERIEQLNLALNQRMGVFVVGAPRTGKSTLWKTLKVVLRHLQR